jgi:hypothetical protein
MDPIEAKKLALEAMRLKFCEMIDLIIKIPCSHKQKEQAILRFDEAHMWMQNGIINYVEPPKPESATEQPQEHHAIADVPQDNKNEQAA